MGAVNTQFRWNSINSYRNFRVQSEREWSLIPQELVYIIQMKVLCIAASWASHAYNINGIPPHSLVYNINLYCAYSFPINERIGYNDLP